MTSSPWIIVSLLVGAVIWTLTDSYLFIVFGLLGAGLIWLNSRLE